METASMVTKVPGWLARSSIYKRIPVHLRQKLDAALLNRASDAMLETIASEFKLSTYGISTATLKKYAKKLEQWVRPSLAAQVLAGVLGCLPESYRRQVTKGGQVILLSRVLQALTADGQHALPVADLAKLASVLTTVGRASSKKAEEKTAEDHEPKGSEPATEEVSIAQRVRQVYDVTINRSEPRPLNQSEPRP